MTIDEVLGQGWQRHKAGRLPQAEQLYRQVLQANPRHARALHLLGVIALQTGRFPEALACLRDACTADPYHADFHCNLALAYRGLGRLPEAEAALRQALQLRPDPEIINNLGTVLLELGRPTEAEAAWRQTLQIKPNHAEAHNNLGAVLMRLGRPAEAETEFREALRLAPADTKAQFNLGTALQALGRLPEAEGAWRHVLRLQPGHAEAHHNLGAAFLELGEPEQAVTHLREALRLHPDLVESRANLGCALLELDRPAEAETFLREALHLNPASAKVHNSLGTVLVQLGRLEEAEHHWRAALRHDPEHPGAHTQLATLLRGRLPEGDRVALERVLAEGKKPEGRSGLLFGLAHVCDGRGEYSAAACHLREANALALAAARQRGKAYDPAEHARFLDDLTAACTPEFFDPARGWGLDTELPVFVFGLPRSGTTLLEQILASHPRVHAAGELPWAGKALNSLPQQLGLSDNLWAAAAQRDRPTVEKVAGSWLEGLQQLGGAAARVVDKMPDNYLYLGLIALLFPRAKLIHCRRDLRDVAVSCWMTSFKQIQWANDPEHIAGRFTAYCQVMEHWRQVLPVPMLEVDYEETVHDLEGVARRLVAWCGLEWDPACLAFHETKRPVRTASAAQVRQPIYRRSVARWKKYEQELAPLFAMLPQA